jgi:N-acetyl-1-D-myo-inositol-2-amino-2-deoxy-alpha-D-glucopyranoside deacetylase
MQHMSSESSSDSEPLGLGATLLSSVFAVLVGAVVGVVTTFTHAQVSPWGLIAGLAIVVALVAGFRLVFESRVVAAAAALGVVAASLVLTLPGAGGVVLAVNDPVGWIWAIAPAILSAVVVVVPRRPARR